MLDAAYDKSVNLRPSSLGVMQDRSRRSVRETEPLLFAVQLHGVDLLPRFDRGAAILVDRT